MRYIILTLTVLFSIHSFSQTEDEIIEKINNKNYKEAIEDATKLISNNSDEELVAYLYYLRAFSYRSIENYFNAKKDYLKSIELGYRYEGAFQNLAAIYFNEEDYSNAALYYEKQLDLLGGDDIFAHYNIGISNYNAKNYNTAIEYFTNVISINSDEETVADAYEMRGKSKNNIKSQTGCDDLTESINLHLDALIQRKRWGYNVDIDYLYNSYCVSRSMYNFYFRQWKKNSKWMFK